MPTRYLKPGICDSEAIDSCSPLAECLFYRLLVNVDDFGRLDARPAVIRSKCFPLKDDTIRKKDVEELLLELQANGLVLLYQSNGCAFLQMNKWDNVPRSKESKCPAPPDTCIQVHTDVNEPRTNLPVTVTGTGTETVNKKPETETGNRKPNAAAVLASLGVSETIAADWIQLRKTKKAAITKTAIDGIQREADKAGISLQDALRICCERGWAGFDASWDWKPKDGQAGFQTAAERRSANTDRAVAEFLGEQTGNVIEGEVVHA